MSIMKEKNSYERRIVCFIDILGFSGKIKETTKNSSEGNANLENICKAIKFINDFSGILHNKIKINGIQSTQFSDSIVISFPWKEKENTIIAAFMLIKYMQVYLIKEFNVLLRGGIVIGDVIHNTQMIVGPAMIDAYQLESKCAFSPRIVIDPKVSFKFNKILKKNKGIGTWNDTTIIHKDLDDTSYIDYFNFADNDDIMTQEEMLEYFSQLCRMIATNVNSSDMSVRVKYLWMRNKIKDSKFYKKPEYKLAYKNIVTNRGKTS